METSRYIFTLQKRKEKNHAKKSKLQIHNQLRLREKRGGREGYKIMTWKGLIEDYSQNVRSDPSSWVHQLSKELSLSPWAHTPPQAQVEGQVESHGSQSESLVERHPLHITYLLDLDLHRPTFGSPPKSLWWSELGRHNLSSITFLASPPSHLPVAITSSSTFVATVG